MAGVDGVPLHRHDVEVGAVNVKRMADVESDTLVDEDDLNDVADVDLEQVSAFAKVLPAAVAILQGELVANVEVVASSLGQEW